MKKVSVVVLNFNGFESTIECVNSLLDQKLDGIKQEIVVVDNGSKDGSVAKLLKEFENKIVLLENKENLGFTGGCNEGIRYALKNDTDYVLLLNNDTTVDKGLMQNLLKTAESDNSIGAVVPKIYFSKGYEFHKSRYKSSELGKVIWYAGGQMDWSNLIGQNIGVDEVDRGQFDSRSETDLSTGCCILIRSNVLTIIGSFDDKYFLYYEDADLSQRIIYAGYKIMYEPKAFLWHKNAESSGVGSDLHDYYITRNRMLFGMKYAPMRTKTALLRESLQLLKSGRKWQKRGIKDYYLRRFGRGSFNI